MVIAGIGGLVAARGSAEFAVTAAHRTGEGIEIAHPLRPGYYYIISKAPAPGKPGFPTAIWHTPAGRRLETDARSCIYWVQEVPLVAPDDTDHDGIDDAFELDCTVLDPLNPADASSDPDHDGADCLTEYRQGTDPAHPTVRDDAGLIDLELFTPLDPL